MSNESFRPRKPQNDESVSRPDLPATPPNANFSPLPPAVQKAMSKVAEQNNPAPPTPPSGPRLAFTGNNNLDALIEGLTGQTHHYEEIQLPSMGRFYTGEEAPADGKVHVRPWTGAEEEIISTPRYFKKGQAINMIFRNCVREPIKPERMLTVDRTFLLIYLRGISYGSDYEVQVRCPACRNKFKTSIDLDRMVTPCPPDLTPESLTDTLPQSGYKFTYRFATGSDDNMITEHQERRAKTQGDQSHDDTFMFRASLLITGIEDPNRGIKINDQRSIMVLLSKMHINDVAYVRNLINEPKFGADTKCDMECPVCAEDFDIEIPMEQSFFFPKNLKKSPP